MIEQAANVLGVSTTGFASATLVAEAQAVLERHQRITLNNEDRDHFLEVLVSNERPNAVLVEAALKFQDSYGK